MCLVDCEGKSSGLALLWTKQANLEIVSFSKHHIDAKVGGDDDSSQKFTGFYRYPETALKYHSQDLLCHLSHDNDLSWFVSGDFNEILSNKEKMGGALTAENLLEMFCIAIHDCGLIEVSFTGSKFTWYRGKRCGHYL